DRAQGRERRGAQGSGDGQGSREPEDVEGRRQGHRGLPGCRERRPSGRRGHHEGRSPAEGVTVRIRCKRENAGPTGPAFVFLLRVAVEGRRYIPPAFAPAGTGSPLAVSSALMALAKTSKGTAPPTNL